jgi:hypothetical protein
VRKKDVELLTLLLMTGGWGHDKAKADAIVLLWFFGRE